MSINENYPALFRFLLKQQISLNLSMDVKIPDTFEQCMQVGEIVKFLVTSVFERKL